MPLTEQQIGYRDKAMVFDDFNTTNPSSNMHGRLPDYYYRDPLFYSENITYDPRYGNYNAGWSDVYDGSCVFNLSAPSYVEFIEHAMGGAAVSGWGANYLQVDSSQMSELACGDGGNVVWRVLDFTAPLSGNFPSILLQSRDSLQCENRDHPVWRALVDNRLVNHSAEFNLFGDGGILAGEPHIKGQGGFSISLNSSENLNSALGDFIFKGLGYVPPFFFLMQTSILRRRVIGEITEANPASIQAGGSAMVVPYNGTEGDMVHIRIESSTFQASGVFYELLVNGQRLPLGPTIGVKDLLSLPSDAEYLDAEYIAVPRISASRLTIPEHSEVIWYDGPIGFVVKRDGTTVHQAGLALGSNAGYYNGSEGWKIGSIG